LKIKFRHEYGMNNEENVREENAVNERGKYWRSYGILACKIEKDIWLGGFDVKKIRNHERRHKMLWKCSGILIL